MTECYVCGRHMWTISCSVSIDNKPKPVHMCYNCTVKHYEHIKDVFMRRCSACNDKIEGNYMVVRFIGYGREANKLRCDVIMCQPCAADYEHAHMHHDLMVTTYLELE